MQTYTITTLDPPPAMTVSKKVVNVEAYAEAVEQAQQSHRESGRVTRLYAGNGSYWYHKIVNGIATDRNRSPRVASGPIKITAN